MFLTPYTSLTWAYQLHYYLCFRTHRRREFFANAHQAEVLTSALTEICQRHDYHLLESQPYPDHLRCLLSLRPEQVISSVVQTVKANASRVVSAELGLALPVWARGYLARSVGSVRLSIVKEYLLRQAEHHGYASRSLPPVYRYRATAPVVLTAQHASFDMHHHLAFATAYRRGIFGSRMGEALGQYWLRVAAKRGFAIDQITIVPDHVHLLVRIVPKLSIAECVLALLNNGQHFVGKNYPHALVEAGVEQLWQASVYAGTRGKYTTALIKAWLSGLC